MKIISDRKYYPRRVRRNRAGGGVRADERLLEVGDRERWRRREGRGRRRCGDGRASRAERRSVLYREPRRYGF